MRRSELGGREQTAQQSGPVQEKELKRDVHDIYIFGFNYQGYSN